MKISNSLIATAVAALLPLAAIAGDKEKTTGSMGADKASAHFKTLDADRDGRISREEAASDSKIVFTTADKNADGYLDSSEYMHRDMSQESMPSTSNPSSNPSSNQSSDPSNNSAGPASNSSSDTQRPRQ